MAFSIGMMSGVVGGVAHTAALLGETALICAIGVFVIYFTIYRRKFNTNVIIISDRVGEQRRILFDKGAFLKKKGNYEAFRLQKDKVNIKPPAFDYLYPSMKGNFLCLLQKGPKEYYPVRFGDVFDKDDATKVLHFKGEEQDVVNWNCVESLRDMQTYGKQTFFEQYGSYIIFAVCAVFILIMLYTLLQKFSVLSDISVNLRDAAQALGSLKQTGNLVPASP